MSWNGMHYSEDSKLALRHMDFNHCRKCLYAAKLQFDHKIFSLDFKCHRCGLIFPVTAINETKWFYDMRNK